MVPQLLNRSLRTPFRWLTLIPALMSVISVGAEPIEFEPDDHICIIGNTLAERFQEFGYFEALLHSELPEHRLVVRNLGFSADEVAFRPRSLNFGEPDVHLSRYQADVIFAFFGFNESFRGPAGLATFERDLEEFIEHAREQHYNGRSSPRLVLCSPIAHEDVGDPRLPDGSANNPNIEAYSRVIESVARRFGVPFVDLFAITQKLHSADQRPLTFNGIHLTEDGYRRLAPELISALLGRSPTWTPRHERIRQEVLEKNFNHFHDYRAINGYYIYGGRSQRDHGNPPYTDAYVMEHERTKLREMAATVDQRIWAVARGEAVSAEVDYTGTLNLDDVPTNFHEPIEIKSPEEARKTFVLGKGYAVNLFASETDWPELKNPVNLTFDARGRLWVATMPSYPQFRPPDKPNDKLLVFDDTDADGRADKMTVFADGLHVPTGFEVGDGGVYVAQEPNVIFLRDTDGDGKADERRTILHGFDSGDSHHAIGAFVWGPGGGIYMHEGTFHITQVETPWGPQRNGHGAVYRFDPTRQKLETWVSYNFANPWGHAFDRWGQDFVADASGGANYWAAAFSTKPVPYTGQADFGPFLFHYQRELKQFFPMRVRPTAGCEIVSSRHFPPEVQGNYLLNNVIGFQGILNHEVRAEGSGFSGKEVEPILYSSDPNFRPTDLQFGPDGALYVVDWFNPLIGHMQHSLRDPQRDKTHGRIWRISYPERPLVPRVILEDKSLDELCDLLTTYEDRTRQHVRNKLREYPTEEVAAALGRFLQRIEPGADADHHRLEALWVYQHHDAVTLESTVLLRQVLRAHDPAARAAATRVLSYWRDRLPPDVGLELLEQQVTDEHPRVRLEAVRAASWFDTPQAAEAALRALALPTDDYLDYVLEHTTKRLQRHWLPVLTRGETFASDVPAAVPYLLKQLTLEELLDLPSGVNVLEELLSRTGTPPQYRSEALRELAALRHTTPAAELARVLEEFDGANDVDEAVVMEFLTLLADLSSEGLSRERERFVHLARQAKRPAVRRLGFSGMIAADQATDAAWKLALESVPSLQQFLQTVPLITDDAQRAELFPRVAPLLHELPAELSHAATSLPDDTKSEIRRDAAKALGYLGGHDTEAFAQLAPLVSVPADQQVAIASLRRLNFNAIPAEGVAPLIEQLVAILKATPEAERTEGAAVEAAQLAQDLTFRLPPELAQSARRRLAELAVQRAVIRSVPHRMQFDRTDIYAVADRPLELLFENVDIMPHNLVITTPGSRQEVGILAERLGATSSTTEHQFVPESDKVLFATRLLQTGERQRLQIHTPQEIGDYPYVCTFPGHWRTMFGTLHVVSDLSQIPLVPPEPTPTEPLLARRFIREWTAQELCAASSELESGRDVERGRMLFQQMSCQQCHAMKGNGGLFGPELSAVKDKLRQGQLTIPEVVQSVVQPSAVIAPEFQTQVVIDDNGRTYSGVVTYEDESIVKLMANPLDETCAVEEIAKSKIDERVASTVSIMPSGLLNTMTRQEIMDLLAYVITAGDPADPAYRPANTGGDEATLGGR